MIGRIRQWYRRWYRRNARMLGFASDPPPATADDRRSLKTTARVLPLRP